MTEVFANTLYWIARVRPNDPWQAVAVGARQKVADATLVTTDEVLSEFLTALTNFEISGADYGIHWSELDEDIGVEGILLGKKSAESAASIERWLKRRQL